MADIEKRNGKHGVGYRVQVRMRGYNLSRTFHDRRAAERWRDQTEDAIKNGTFEQVMAEQAAAQQTLEMMVERYVALPSRSHQKTRHASDALLYNWVVVLDDYAAIKVKVDGIGRIGSITVSAVTTAMVQAELDKMVKRGNKAGTVNRRRNALHAFYQWCIKVGVVEVNPVTRTDKLKEPRGRVRWLSDDERVALFAACKASHCPYLYCLVVVACYSGMRQGELTRLEWSDVDLTTGQATVQISKNGERRATSILGPALQALKEWRTSGVVSIGRKRVFPGFPRHSWERAMKDAQVTDFHFHDLRHTCASYLAQMGASNRELMECLGHKTLQMVARYSHLAPSHMLGLVGRMTERFR